MRLLKPDTRRLLVWALLATCTLFLFASGSGLVTLSQSLAIQRKAVSDQALLLGRRGWKSLEASGFRQPSEPSWRVALLPPDLPPSPIQPQGMALLFGTRVLWTEPAFAPPRVDAPPKGTEEVIRQGGRWLYLRSLEDGRLLMVTFAAPAYERLRGRYVLLSVFEAVGLTLLGLLWIWLALRLYRSYQGLASTARDASEYLPPPGGGSPALAMVEVFQHTLHELRARSDELAELHQREKRRAEEVEGLAEALCANLEAGYLRFDEAGRLSGLNAAGRSLLGLPTVPRLGDAAEALLAARPEALAALTESMDKRSLTLREEVPGAPGLLLQVVGIPLFNLLHQLRGYLLIMKDQTSLYQMRRTIREREALSRLGEVAAGVAHEVRNSLSTFTAHIKLLAQDRPEMAGQAHYQGLLEEVRGLEAVVQNLLFFARPLPLVTETIPIEPLLDEEAQALRQQFPDLQVEVSAGGGDSVRADREALARAIRNLTRNAAEAHLQGGTGRGRVRLSCGLEPEGATIRVEDDGPGLSPEAAQELFVPFASQKPGGTGLGLAIARKIVREHGGELSSFASPLGGAGFQIRLPS